MSRHKHMLIFGLGYTASRLADALRQEGWRIDATGSDGNLDFEDAAAVGAAMAQASHDDWRLVHPSLVQKAWMQSKVCLYAQSP